MDMHITILAVIYIAYGILGLMIGMVVFWSIASGGLTSGNLEAIYITGIVAAAVSALFLVGSILEIIGGIALLKRTSWSRIFVLILGVLSLIEIPIGTAIGIYTIWVLVQKETGDILCSKKTTPVAPAVSA
jgi:hypothetical protein